MSLKTKKSFKNIGKVVAGVLFALLLFTNIKVALMDDTELVSGDISLLGVELTLFDATYACNPEVGYREVNCIYDGYGALIRKECLGRGDGTKKCECEGLT